MKKRIEPTLVEKAIDVVPGFELVFKKLSQQVTLRGQSQSTLNNYIRCIANVNLHSLRHAYATHLLEEGLNIVTLKGLLGHAEITTTMIYLHVAQCPAIKAHSPLDTLYGRKI